MEHRCTVRKAVSFHVLLYKHGLPIQAGVCRNLGLGGLFVESAGYDWRRNEFLQVELIGCDGKSALRLPAVVAHHSMNGAGLMFDAISSEQRRLLRVLLSRVAGETLPLADRAVA